MQYSIKLQESEEDNRTREEFELSKLTHDHDWECRRWIFEARHKTKIWKHSGRQLEILYRYCESDRPPIHGFCSYFVKEFIEQNIPIGSRLFLMDGTFDKLPLNYYQLLIIAVEFRGDVSTQILFRQSVLVSNSTWTCMWSAPKVFSLNNKKPEKNPKNDVFWANDWFLISFTKFHSTKIVVVILYGSCVKLNNSISSVNVILVDWCTVFYSNSSKIIKNYHAKKTNFKRHCHLPGLQCISVKTLQLP